MIRVCFVQSGGSTLAGSELSLLNMLAELKKYETELFVTCPVKGDVTDAADSMGIKTYVLPTKGFVMSDKKGIHSKQHFYYPIKKARNFFLRKKAVQFLKQNKIDIVHLNTSVASEVWAKAAKELNIPYVWHLREFLDLDHHMTFVNKRYAYDLMRQANRVITISKAIKNHWENRIKRETDLVYDGLPAKDYCSEHCRGFGRQALKYLMVGRIVETKGQMDAIKAVEILKSRGIRDVKLTIVGYIRGKKYDSMLADYIKQNHLEHEVELVEYTYDLKQIRDGHDVGLTCSKAEAFGRVTVEYMMAGLVAVGSNAGGTAEIIEHGNSGYLYEYGNPESLANQLEYIGSHRAEAEKVAKTGQARAMSEFSIEKNVREVYRIYQEILDKI